MRMQELNTKRNQMYTILRLVIIFLFMWTLTSSAQDEFQLEESFRLVLENDSYIEDLRIIEPTLRSREEIAALKFNLRSPRLLPRHRMVVCFSLIY